MDFDGSKENILPLRGGRNVSQLGDALQAQNDATHQRKLIECRQEFERLIAQYTGDDPLENWFNYISWVEQSYPKQGHEGNIVHLLEDCLKLFEHDPRYINDLRMCKLYIKYIDLQPNPLELYHMLYANEYCRKCAEFYKAWAYYFELSADFQNAHKVIERGKREGAQPYSELEAANDHLLIVAGHHAIHGMVQQDFTQHRQALTSLKNFKAGPRILPQAAGTSSTNVQIPVYKDKGDENEGVEIGPKSVIAVARREEAPKENTLKPGPWTTVPVAKKQAVSRPTPGFLVHEDGAEASNVFPSNFVSETRETYSNWIVDLFFREPKDDRMIPMYPKEKVYSQVHTEYSLEELRAIRYLVKKKEIEDVKIKSSPSTCLLGLTSFDKIHEANSEQVGEGACAIVDSDFDTKPKLEVLLNESFNIWNSPNTNSPSVFAVKPKIQKFPIFEESNFTNRIEPKGDAMKTPLKNLNAEELAETGSRGGMDIAAAAPVDSAKRLDIYEDDSSSPFGIEPPEARNFADLTCNTQMFNFNLNAMQVSTPKNKEEIAKYTEEMSRIAPKQLFSEGTSKSPEKNKLSVIFEESKTSGSLSSGSGNGTAKSSITGSQVKQTTMATISEEHSSYLAQNLLANAALRTSLLGELVDLEPQTSFRHRRFDVPTPAPTTVSPLEYVPSDPFQTSLIEFLLKKVNFPGNHTHGYCYLPVIPKPTLRKETFNLGNDSAYLIDKQLGKGTFGTVFRGTNITTGKLVAVKYQRRPNKWEFYICRELQSRLAANPLRDRFMKITNGYFSENSSVLISEFVQSGSLLDVVNVVKQRSGRSLKECMCIHFTLEMLKIVQAMHEVQIIHADIKPDNFLVKLFPNDVVGLQLIDFGCSIDMSLFPPGASFTRKVTTENFICCEMLDEKPWNYHTDLFCVAATAHVLLFEKYIQMNKRGGNWFIQYRMPRYMNVDLWNIFFNTLLNQHNGPADTATLQSLLEESLNTNFDNYQNELRYLTNILKNR